MLFPYSHYLCFYSHIIPYMLSIINILLRAIYPPPTTLVAMTAFACTQLTVHVDSELVCGVSYKSPTGPITVNCTCLAAYEGMKSVICSYDSGLTQNCKHY